MNNRMKWLVGIILCLVSLGVVAGTVYDRLAPNVTIGQGQNVVETILFDQGNPSTNAKIGVDTSQNITFNNPSILSGYVTMSGGGSMSGTWAGNPNFSGEPTFSASPNAFVVTAGTPNFESGLIVSGGGLTVTGATALNSTGGNVPHGCFVYWNNSPGGTQEVACGSSSMIAVGGGCEVGAGVGIQTSCPSNGSGSCILSSGSTTAWHWLCSPASGNSNDAWAVCCSY